MATCRVCGQSIDIRWVGGALVPIHPNGWCPGSSSGGSAGGGVVSTSFRTMVSYVDPNAHCPVCGQQVFFYQSPHGGRVFFDALGWPWPKHKCTDKKSAQSGAVRPVERPKRTMPALQNSKGIRLLVFSMSDLEQVEGGYRGKFERNLDRRVYYGFISDAEMAASKLTEDDLRDAPSFVMTPRIDGESDRTAQIISVRLKRIVTFKITKA
ncbi:hypothetical protein LJR016_002260 [Devosia sp. LjRoot16]|uniref:hypothetical protein n=1 Tax=Devosia sp. LjRoot16 TaxID=3342271 RepID=UPI003ECF9825